MQPVGGGNAEEEGAKAQVERIVNVPHQKGRYNTNFFWYFIYLLLYYFYFNKLID